MHEHGFISPFNGLCEHPEGIIKPLILSNNFDLNFKLKPLNLVTLGPTKTDSINIKDSLVGLKY